MSREAAVVKRGRPVTAHRESRSDPTSRVFGLLFRPL